MAGLTSSTIAASYDQLLIVDNDGGGDGTTHVAVKDGDGTTTFPLTLASDAVMITSTNRLEFGDDASYIHQSADGVLDLVSDTEIELTATTIDINGAITMTKALSSDTQSTPEEVLAIKAKYGNTGTDGVAGAGSLLSFYIPDDETNPAKGAGIAGLRESADDSNMSSALAFYTSGDDESISEKVRINSSGYLGIGLDPSRLLHLRNADNQLARFESTNAYAEIELKDNNTGANPPAVGVITNDMYFNTSNAERMRITSTGQIGIGTASADAYSTSADNLVIYDANHAGITIACPTNKSGNLFFADGTGDSDTTEHRGFIQYDHGNVSTDTMMIGTAGAERMRITSDGEVGIGQTTVNAMLDIDDGATGDFNNIGKAQIRVGSINNVGVRAQIGFGWGGDSTYVPVTVGAIGTSGSGYTKADFVINTRDATTDSAPTEKMRITSAGNVGINDTSPGMKLTVVTDHASGYAASFHNDVVGGSGNANRYGIRVIAGTDDGSGNNYHVSCMDGDNDLEGALRVDSGTFSLYDNSDRRLKDNIRDTEINGIDIVHSIKVRDFEWKKSGATHIAGFVAQELKESFEPASPDSEDDLYEGKPKMMAISRERLVPVLIKAVQELAAKVEALENA
jgi:hypothetical protein